MEKYYIVKTIRQNSDSLEINYELFSSYDVENLKEKDLQVFLKNVYFFNDKYYYFKEVPEDQLHIILYCTTCFSEDEEHNFKLLKACFENA